jgi:hypothetical protein
MWNYTQTLKNLLIQFPKLDFSRFKRDKKKEDDNRETAYINLDSPAGCSEVIKFRQTSISDWKTDKTLRTSYAPSSKRGYSFKISDYTTWRETTADGDVYDNPIQVSISCAATEGTAVEGGIMTGADWIPHINRAYALALGLLYDLSDDQMTLLEQQDQLDMIMHGATDLVNAIKEQA